jgi:hypothetical protein
VHGTITRTNITVTAKLTVGGAAGLTLTDQAIVNVVQQTSADLVPMMDSLIFRPVAGDSASRSTLTSAGTLAGILPTAQDFDIPVVRDELGNEIPNAVVRYKSADDGIARFNFQTSSTVTAVSPGAVLLTAEATVYGKSITDTILYVVGWPLFQEIVYGYGITTPIISGVPVSTATPPNQIRNDFNTDDYVIGQGGAILWINQTMGLTDDSMDVQFDDTVGVRGPTVPTTINTIALFPFPPFGFQYPVDPSANIPALGTIQQISFAGFLLYSTNASNSAIRYFTRSGTYHWRSIRRGLSGTIRVVSNDSIH